MKNQFQLIILALLVIFSACQEDEPAADLPPTLSTNPVINITGTTATMGGTVTDEGSGLVDTRGVCWSFNGNPTTNDNSQLADGSGLGTFSVNIEDLEANTTYHVRAFAYNNIDQAYGEDLTFTTAGLMSFATDIARDILSTRAKLSGTISEASSTLGSKGFVVGTKTEPTANNDLRFSDGLGDGPIDVLVTGLEPNTNYFARPYSIAGGEYYYGDEITFRTVGFAGPANGVVVYDKGEMTENWRYLEVAPEENLAHEWGCQGKLITNTIRGLGAGPANTHQINTNCSDLDCAAKVAANYSFGGQGDWFLPSIEEGEFILRSLKEMWSPYRQNYLWTSNEVSALEAYYLYWHNDEIKTSYSGKRNLNPVLPVRRY